MKTNRRKLFLGLVAALVLIATATILLLRLGNATGVEDFRHRAFLSHREAADDREAVARELVERWLDHFASGEAGWAARLAQHRIDHLDVTPAQGRLIVSATLSVKPRRWSLDNWLAGSGGRVEDGWIHGKFIRFAVIETDEGFFLEEVGPAP